MSDTGKRRDPSGADSLAVEVAATARILARAGLLHAFGHVSARIEAGYAITPTRPPLAVLEGADIVHLDADGVVRRGDRQRLPLEAPMHAAIYRRRPDVQAIARIHGSALAAWATRPEAPPLLHGFGGIVEPVAVWTDPDLIADAETASAVATALGDAPAVILRGNGGLAVGATLGEAAARAWCLEDRCAVAERAAGQGRPFSDEELARRSRWFDAETRRLWAWLQLACADPA